MRVRAAAAGFAEVSNGTWVGCGQQGGGGPQGEQGEQ